MDGREPEQKHLGENDEAGMGNQAVGDGSGTTNGLVTGLGIRSALHRPQASRVEKEYRKLLKENELLQGELYKCHHRLEHTYNHLQKTIGEARNYCRAAKEAQHEVQKLGNHVQSLEHELLNVTKKYEDAKSLSDIRGKELVDAQVLFNKTDSPCVQDSVSKKLEVAEAFLHESIPPFLSNLEGLNNAIRDVSNFLFANIVFRISDAFSHELQAARELLLPLLSLPLMDLVTKHAEKAATVNDGTMGSRMLVRVSSQVVLCRYLDVHKGSVAVWKIRSQLMPSFFVGPTPQKDFVLKIFIDLFRFASWSLPGAANRSAFEAVLGKAISAAVRLRAANLPQAMNVKLLLPNPEDKYESSAMEVVGVDGKPPTEVAKDTDEVIGTIAYGVKKDDKVALKPLVILKSELQKALAKAEQDLFSTQASTKQPEGDGRA